MKIIEEKEKILKLYPELSSVYAECEADAAGCKDCQKAKIFSKVFKSIKELGERGNILEILPNAFNNKNKIKIVECYDCMIKHLFSARVYYQECLEGYDHANFAAVELRHAMREAPINEKSRIKQIIIEKSFVKKIEKIDSIININHDKIEQMTAIQNAENLSNPESNLRKELRRLRKDFLNGID